MLIGSHSGAAGARMETVENDPGRLPPDLPLRTISQAAVQSRTLRPQASGLIAKGEAEGSRPIGELGKIVRNTIRVVDRLFGNIRTQAQSTRPELRHQIKFPCRSFEISGAGGLRHRFEIPHRLQCNNFEAEIGGPTSASRGFPSKKVKSFSNISMALNLALAAAASFTSREPPMATPSQSTNFEHSESPAV